MGNFFLECEEVYRSVIQPGLPVIVRVDGRAFHTVTSRLEKPFDNEFILAMNHVALTLMEEFTANAAYTQSDEVSLVFIPKSHAWRMMFGGRVQKIASVIAGVASSAFALAVASNSYLASRVNGHVWAFDARVFTVPSVQVCIDYLAWREADATKNSLKAVAQRNFTHSEQIGKKAADQHEMLHRIGVNWNDLPARYKRGIYYYRSKVNVSGVERSVVAGKSLHIARVKNIREVITRGDDPEEEIDE